MYIVAITIFSLCCADYVDLIIYFGLDGNGYDRLTRNLGQRNLNIHCGSGIEDVQISWYYQNQTEVSYTDEYLRQGSNTDGISILQIGNRRGVDYCDAGVYVCKATLVTEEGVKITQSRTFTLRVQSKET